MSEVNQLLALQTGKAPRQEIRHHWGVHVSEAADKELQWLQQELFEQGTLPKNTKYALVRRCIDIALAAAQKRRAQVPIPVAPVSQPVPRPDPVMAHIEAQLAQLQAERQARLQVSGGVSQ